MKRHLFAALLLGVFPIAQSAHAFTYERIAPPARTIVPSDDAPGYVPRPDAEEAKPWARTAQLPLTGVGVGSQSSGGGGSYTGPGDVVGSAVFWAGLRAYTAAYATALGNAVELCTIGDALCTVIHVTSAGALNSSDLTTSGCSAITTCTAKTIYDQSGNGHNCTSTSEAARPHFFPNGISSGKPSLHSTTGDLSSCASLPTTTVPWTFVAVSEFDSTPGANDRVFTAVDPTGLLRNPSNQYVVYAGSLGVSGFTASTGVFYAVIGRTDGSGSGGVTSVSNNVTTGLAAGSGSTGTPGKIFNGDTADQQGSEWGYWGSNFSTGNTTAMDSNMRTYWGI